jgi:hypothetical protein
MRASRILHILMAVFFAMSAYLNLNDPDPWVWVGGYVVMTVISFIEGVTKNGNLAFMGILVLSIATICQSLVYLNAQHAFEEFHVNSMWTALETEQGRELGGLLLISLEGLLLVFIPARNSPLKSNSYSEKIFFMIGLSALGVAFYSMFYLQPLMNVSHYVEHCSGMLRPK